MKKAAENTQKDKERTWPKLTGGSLGKSHHKEPRANPPGRLGPAGLQPRQCSEIKDRPTPTPVTSIHRGQSCCSGLNTSLPPKPLAKKPPDNSLPLQAGFLCIQNTDQTFPSSFGRQIKVLMKVSPVSRKIPRVVSITICSSSKLMTSSTHNLHLPYI